MLNHPKFKYSFNSGDITELEILQKYWSCDENGEFFETAIKNIINNFSITQGSLNTLVKNKSDLEWDFGICSCGNPITFKIKKRADLKACVTNSGSVEGFWVSSVSRHFSECKRCRDEKHSLSFENEWEFSDSFKEKMEGDNQIREAISTLAVFDLKILNQIYTIRDFQIIKETQSVFPVRFGDHARAVWASLYKLSNLRLIDAIKKGNRINDLIFFDEVGQVLENLPPEIIDQVNYIDQELTMEKISHSGRTKYFTILEPDKDLTLKAGVRYEIIATETLNKNIILRIVSI